MKEKTKKQSLTAPLLASFDAWSFVPSSQDQRLGVEDWARCLPYILMHLGCLLVIWVGWSSTALSVAAGLFFIRMFAITGFYHRYFSHRTFETSRIVQFLFALIGSSSIQRGPLWWAAHHRHHHAHSDKEDDTHSPHVHSLLWSHTIWFMAGSNYSTKKKYVRDWLRFPELVWIDRFDTIIPFTVGLILYGIGELLPASFATSGLQLLTWGFFISTTLLYHSTFTINSLGHRFGSRPYETNDKSRNNFWLALLTLGEGWHNNHHYYPNSVRQGFKWWEIDITFYILKIFSWMGIVRNLKPVPVKISKRGH